MNPWWLVIALCLVDGLLAHELMKVWDEKGKQPPNDPLTLEQLRKMGGESVWVQCLFAEDYSVWTIVDICLNGIHTKYFYADFDYYGDEWLAYRRKPEEK